MSDLALRSVIIYPRSAKRNITHAHADPPSSSLVWGESYARRYGLNHHCTMVIAHFSPLGVAHLLIRSQTLPLVR